MTVRLAFLATLLDVSQNIKIQFRIMMKNAFARRHVVIECSGYESRICEETRKPVSNLRQSITEGIRSENNSAIGAEFVE